MAGKTNSREMSKDEKKFFQRSYRPPAREGLRKSSAARPDPGVAKCSVGLPLGRMIRWVAGRRVKASSQRRRTMKKLLSYCAFLGLAAAWGGRLPAAELAAGDAAPDFSLPGSDGETYRLADFKG